MRAGGGEARRAIKFGLRLFEKYDFPLAGLSNRNLHRKI